jgi:photosystem II stability/assembly factor-like uncharacterized protein
MKNSAGCTFLVLLFFFLTSTRIAAQWAQTNGPYGGTINCLASNNQIMFAGTRGGLFKSDNNGVSWSACTLDQVNNLNVKPAIMISGVQIIGKNVIVSSNAGFFISRDYGSSWNRIESFPLFNHIPDFFIIKKNFLMYSCKNYNYIFRTDDSLTSFNQIGYFGTLIDTFCHSFEIIGDKIFAGGDFGVLMSSDSGKTWVKCNDGLNGNIVSLISKDNLLFAGTDNGYVFKSTNMGGSWKILNFGLKCSRINCLALNDNKIYAGTNGDGIFISSDDGTNWHSLKPGLENPYINTLTFTGNVPIAGTSGSGVFSYNLKWNSINQGLSATEITSFVELDGNIFVSEKGGGIYVTADGGINWSSVNSGLTCTDVRALAVKGNKLFAGTYGGGIYVSENKGETWNSCNTGIYQKYISALTVNGNNIFAGTCFPPSAPSIIGTNEASWADSGIVFFSSDEGYGWEALFSKGFTIRSLATLNQQIFAAGLFRTYVSKGDFSTWLWLGQDDSLSDGRHQIWEWANHIKSFGISENNIFAGTTQSGIYFSSDMGMTWTIKNKFKGIKWSAPGYNACSFAIRNSDVFVSLIDESSGIKTSRWIYKFDSSDSTWIPADTISSHFFLFGEPAAISLFIQDEYLYAGTNGFGVWKLNIAGLSNIKNKGIVSNNYDLSQNYPNPFNPVTTISYSIPKSAFVTLKIYDILGKEVSVLVNEEKPAGSYNIVFNANALSSGVYFYRLQAGSYSETKKLSLIK